VDGVYEVVVYVASVYEVGVYKLPRRQPQRHLLHGAYAGRWLPRAPWH